MRFHIWFVVENRPQEPARWKRFHASAGKEKGRGQGKRPRAARARQRAVFLALTGGRDEMIGRRDA